MADWLKLGYIVRGMMKKLWAEASGPPLNHASYPAGASLEVWQRMPNVFEGQML